MDIVDLGWIGLFAYAVFRTSKILPISPPSTLIYASFVPILVNGYTTLFFYVFLCVIGRLMGSLILYTFARKCNIMRIPYITHNKIEMGKSYFKKYGQSVVIWGRFIPILQSYLPVIAGMMHMDKKLYITYTLIGLSIFHTLLGLGMWFASDMVLEYI